VGKIIGEGGREKNGQEEKGERNYLCGRMEKGNSFLVDLVD